MNRKLQIGDIVYLVLAPNNYIKEYRYVKCMVTKILFRKSSHRTFVEYDNLDYNDKAFNDIKLCLTNVDDTTKYYCSKSLEKIYYYDELDRLNTDIENLNKILQFKVKQKQELKDFVEKEFPNWAYKVTLNI